MRKFTRKFASARILLNANSTGRARTCILYGLRIKQLFEQYS